MLLPHNKKVYDDIKDSYRYSKSLLVVHGTGLGKSFLFLELCESILKDKKILFVVPKHATKTGGIGSYDEYKSSDADIEFVTYNYFKDENRAVNAALKYDVIVYDEAHHLGSDLYGMNALKTFPLIENSKGKYILGLTATNVRNDKVDVRQYFKDTVIGCSIFDAIRQGLIPSFEYLICRDNAEEVAGYDKNLKDYRKKIDYSDSLPLLQEVVQNNPKKRWLVFFPSIKAIQENEQTVRDAFTDDYKILTITAYNDTETSEIEKYEKTVVLCVDKLLEGVHVPGTTGIILFRNIRSLPVFQQVLGRVVHVGEKEHPLIVDCTQSAVRMLAKLLRADAKGHGAAQPGIGNKPILYCSLQNAEHFNIAKLLALAEDLPWTDGEVDILRKEYNNKSMKELQKLLPDRKPGAIHTKAQKLGLAINREHKWTDEELKVLREHAGNSNITELQRLLPGKTSVAIKSKMKTLGISMVYAHAFWTEKEDDIIRKNADKMTWKEMEKLLPGRKAQSIKVRANKTLNIVHNKKWTKEQDEWLRSVYDTMDIEAIAEHLGKRKEAVLVHARSIGLNKRPKRKDMWTEDMVLFLVQNYVLLDRNEIAAKIGVDPKQVTAKAARMGLKKVERG